jgi:hypothetical protein
MDALRKHVRMPSPAMVVACLALLVALSGTGYAISVLPAGSVGTAQLKDNAVTYTKIANGAVTSEKVRNRSLLAVDFYPGQLPRGQRGPAGAPGPAGPQGTAGPAGPAGTAGLISNVVVRQGAVTVPGSSADNPTPNTFWVTRGVTVNCASGEKAISAGTGWSADVNDLELATVWIKPLIQPDGSVTGYSAKGANNARDGQDHIFTLYVLCYK